MMGVLSMIGGKTKYKEEEMRLGKLTDEVIKVIDEHYSKVEDLKLPNEEKVGYEVSIVGFVYEGKFVDTHSNITTDYNLKIRQLVSLGKGIKDYEEEKNTKLDLAVDWLLNESNLLEEGVTESFLFLYKDGEWEIYNEDIIKLNDKK